MTNENTSPTETPGFVLGNVWYTKLKWLVQVVLPAFGTLYFTLGSVWGLPNVEAVLATITALSLFLGTVLGISSHTYNNSNLKYSGIIEVFDDPAESKTGYSITYDGDLENLPNEQEVTLKVFKR